MIYYTIPGRFRWYSLLAGSLCFYYFCAGAKIIFLLGIAAISYSMAFLIEKKKAEPFGKLILSAAVAAVLLPFSFFKFGIGEKVFGSYLISPLGLSFFSLQIISYVVDVYRGKILPQKNFLKYLLFVSFFPQIIQGPICRYEQTQNQLCTAHEFDETGFIKGFQLVLWGFFLKLMIADKAGIAVDKLFSEYLLYAGASMWVAGILYSVQLYADFLASVCIARGIAAMFGIELPDNFDHPYFAASIKDFWHRWHISLSRWLKDYVYIPLGGSHKGKRRKYINLLITFVVSGFWHGTGKQFLFWGLMHGFYQVLEDITLKYRNRMWERLKLSPDNRWVIRLRKTVVFILVMLAWVMFRAPGLKPGLVILKGMFTSGNFGAISASCEAIGLSCAEWAVLALSVAVLYFVSRAQEKMCIRDRILSWPVFARLGLYVAAMVVIVVFGTYGYGFNAQDFIYGGF